ncbi:MAG: hypothetical protein ACSHYF_07675 [Verrucomicrobiaceae bacterium]
MKLLLIPVLLLTLVSCSPDTGKIAPEMTGSWSGEAKVIVDWVKQPSLPVAIEINQNGTVSGTIGDATLSEATLKPNRGAIGKKLNLATDFIITGNLRGPLIQSENITRDSVSIPLNFSTDRFTGGIHTSGSKLGKNDTRIFSAANLTLRPTQ